MGQPIQDRHRENEDRPRAFEELGKKLQLYMKFVDSYKQKVNPLKYAMPFNQQTEVGIVFESDAICMFCILLHKYCVTQTGSVLIIYVHIHD